MSQTKRLLEQDLERSELNSFLEALVSEGYLEGAVLGITQQVMDKGQESLTDRQKDVFDTYVLEKYVQDCNLCGSEIPWGEMGESLHNGGYCGSCAYQKQKWERE